MNDGLIRREEKLSLLTRHISNLVYDQNITITLLHYNLFAWSFRATILCPIKQNIVDNKTCTTLDSLGTKNRPELF